jgi:hypothetical protein
MSINILEQNDTKVTSCSKKRKVVEREELQPQLNIYIVEEMFVKTFERKLVSGERFQR